MIPHTYVFYHQANSKFLTCLGGTERREWGGWIFWMSLGTDICSSLWLLGPQPALEGQGIPEAKNTFCPLIGRSGGRFTQMCASWQRRLPRACRLAGCNMLYLGLHLRPYGPSAAAPYRGPPAATRGPDGADDTCAGPSDSALLETWCAENGRL